MVFALIERKRRQFDVLLRLLQRQLAQAHGGGGYAKTVTLWGKKLAEAPIKDENAARHAHRQSAPLPVYERRRGVRQRREASHGSLGSSGPFRYNGVGKDRLGGKRGCRKSRPIRR
jgi:hypothetical protein